MMGFWKKAQFLNPCKKSIPGKSSDELLMILNKKKVRRSYSPKKRKWKNRVQDFFVHRTLYLVFNC